MDSSANGENKKPPVILVEDDLLELKILKVVPCPLFVVKLPVF